MKSFSIIPNEDIDFIKKALQTIIEGKEKKINDDVLDNADVLKLFKISKRTLQTWRDRNYIKYSKIDGKIFYMLSDLMHLINENKNN
jgi:hypothetical protein